MHLFKLRYAVKVITRHSLVVQVQGWYESPLLERLHCTGVVNVVVMVLLVSHIHAVLFAFVIIKNTLGFDFPNFEIACDS